MRSLRENMQRQKKEGTRAEPGRKKTERRGGDRGRVKASGREGNPGRIMSQERISQSDVGDGSKEVKELLGNQFQVWPLSIMRPPSGQGLCTQGSAPPCD